MKQIKAGADIVSAAADPSCPEAIMQWQHGTYEIFSNGSLVMTPFAVDGRQLYSTPCTADYGVYTRYNQTETMKVCHCCPAPPHPYSLHRTPSQPPGQSTNIQTPTGVLSRHRLLPRHSTPKPLRMGRHPYPTSVLSLLAPSDASNHHPQPYHLCRRRNHNLKRQI